MVGSAVVRKYKKEGFDNLILRSRQELDLLDQKAVKDFFAKEKPEFVIFCAARVGGIRANMTQGADFCFENLEIQNNVIWSAHQNNVKKFLFLGSSCIYPRECSQPIKEEYFLSGPLEPTNEGYAIAKIAGMKLCEKIFDQYGQTFISCMPTNLHGENDNFDPETAHAVPAMIRRMHEAKINNLPEVVVWGTGKPRREFMYVDDLAEAVFWLMENYDKKEFLNVGTGEDKSIKELAEAIKKVVGYKGGLVFDTTKPDGMPRKLLDVSKINSLGWKHKIDLEEGLKMTYEHFLVGRIKR